jgi:dihydrofolate reductase
MNIRIVIAMGRNREIGQNGNLPWNLPRDLQHFREKTLGKPVIMGRETFESIGKLLPKRSNIILTRNPEYFIAGALIVHSIAEALQVAAAEKAAEACVIGGGKVCELALPFATHLSLTFVEADFPEADVFFPEIDWSEWREVSREKHTRDERNDFDFSFAEFERITPIQAL